MSRFVQTTARQKQLQYLKRHKIIRRAAMQRTPMAKKTSQPSLAFSRAKVYEMLMGFTAPPFKTFVASIATKTHDVKRTNSMRFR